MTQENNLSESFERPNIGLDFNVNKIISESNFSKDPQSQKT